MAMVNVDGRSLCQLTHSQVGWLGLRVGGQLVLGLHSPNELSQWLCHDDCTINVTVPRLTQPSTFCGMVK